jgi:hypothetical protein
MQDIVGVFYMMCNSIFMNVYKVAERTFQETVTVTRVRGFGMMDENETAASQNNSPETTFTQNQLNCLNLDDGWWTLYQDLLWSKHVGHRLMPEKVQIYRHNQQKQEHRLHHLKPELNLLLKAQQLRHRQRKRKHQHHQQM